MKQTNSEPSNPSACNPVPGSRFAAANRVLSALALLLMPFTYGLMIWGRPDGASYSEAVTAWQMWVGVLGVLAIPLLALASVITGHVARSRQKKVTDPTGKSASAAGLILAYLGLLLAVMLVPSVIKANIGPSRNACINNLRQIDGAKEQWALENKKTATDIPTWNDLIGPDKYIKVRHECERGGYYHPNNMATKPTCNYPGHTLM